MEFRHIDIPDTWFAEGSAFATAYAADAEGVSFAMIPDGIEVAGNDMGGWAWRIPAACVTPSGDGYSKVEMRADADASLLKPCTKKEKDPRTGMLVTKKSFNKASLPASALIDALSAPIQDEDEEAGGAETELMEGTDLEFEAMLPADVAAIMDRCFTPDESPIDEPDFDVDIDSLKRGMVEPIFEMAAAADNIDEVAATEATKQAIEIEKLLAEDAAQEAPIEVRPVLSVERISQIIAAGDNG